MAGKRYFWLKLSEDFFSETYIKALRRLPSGDSLVIVYLKMQLKSLKTEGLLKYCGLLPDSMAELAMALDEDESIVRLTVEALIRFKLIERQKDETLYVAAVRDLIGSEGSSAERMRQSRAAKKLTVNSQNSQCSVDISDGVDIVRTMCAQSDGELEKELEKDIELELDFPPVSPSGGTEFSGQRFEDAPPAQNKGREEISSCWRKNIGEPNPTIYRIADGWLQKGMESGLICCGIEQSVSADHPKLYLNRILINWHRKGILTLKAYESSRSESLPKSSGQKYRPKNGNDGLSAPSYDLNEINHMLLESVRSLCQGAAREEAVV